MSRAGKNITTKEQGFSLLEMMIAMVIGLTLISGAITVFSGSRKSIDLNSALTDIQDNARFAMDTITRDLRMAGFQGCVDINTSAAKILADASPTMDYFNTAVVASVVESATAWNPPESDAFTIPNTRAIPVPGTHALSVQFGSPQTFTFEPMKTVDAEIVLDSTDSGLADGDLALISNCQVADIFEITSANGSTLQHTSDGNTDKRLSAPYGIAGNDNMTRVMRFEANIYYIGDTKRTNGAGDQIFSLYKQTLPYNTTNIPIEMIEGVANMQIRLGIRDPGDTNDNGLTFVSPDDVAGTSGRVEVVQFGLLMQSYDSILEVDDESTYALAGTTLSPAPAPVDSAVAYPSDRRMKLAFNTTVKIRNRR